LANTLLAGAKEFARNNATNMLPESDPRSGTELNRRTEGLDVRKNLSSKKEGKVFFLDIPFYRTRAKCMGPSLRSG